MLPQELPIAFFDSGLGGISVLRETVRLLPQEHYLYYGDSLHAPYGVKTAEEVLALPEANEKAEKGEYCLVLDMSGVELEAQEEKSDASLEAQLFEEMLSGFDLRQAALTLTERGHKRNDVYRARTNVQRFLDDLMSDYAFEEEDDSDE